MRGLLSLMLAAALVAVTALPAAADYRGNHGGRSMQQPRNGGWIGDGRGRGNWGGNHNRGNWNGGYRHHGGGFNLNPGLPQAPQIRHGGGFGHHGSHGWGGGPGLAILGAILGGAAIAGAASAYATPQYVPQCDYWGPQYWNGYQWTRQWLGRGPCR